MRQVEHKLTELNVEARTAMCAKCGHVRVYAAPNSRVDGVVTMWACGRKPAERQRTGPSKGSGSGRKLTHVLSELDESSQTAVCAQCGPVRVFEGKGRRVRVGQKFVCSRRPPEKGVGGPPSLHRLTEIDEAAKRAVCAICGPTGIVWRDYQAGGGRWGCIVTRGTMGRSAYKWHEDYKRAICPYCNQWHRWDRGQGKLCRERLEQDRGNQCEVCHDTPSDGLRVDHDHQTGAVRGLLCRNCNVALGMLKDSRERVGALLDYLSR